MPKRKIDEEDGVVPPAKRRRSGSKVLLCSLSDELLLKTLMHLSPRELGITAGVSHRFKTLSDDPELWKEKYYRNWVRPRVLRIPGVRNHTLRQETIRYSSNVANWLDQRHLAFPSRISDWKQQYRLRNNWHEGTCKMRVLSIEQPPAAPAIFKIHKGIIFTADQTHGLRAWSNDMRGPPLASKVWRQGEILIPSALAVDASCPDVVRIGLGCSNGSFRCYEFSESDGFTQYCMPQRVGNPSARVTALTMNFPYVLAMVNDKSPCLSRIQSGGHWITTHNEPALAVICQLENQQDFKPLSLSIRRYKSEVIATIAYTYNRLNSSAWGAALQELRFTHKEVPLDIAKVRSLSWEDQKEYILSERPKIRTFTAQTPTFTMHREMISRPASLSYAHPYLLASLPDNTLMVYLVVSDSGKLEIKNGRRLWGHTSGISGAEVNDRGKAVSVSTKGGEIRVWDLEDVVAAAGDSTGKTSTRLVPHVDKGDDGWAVAKQGLHPELAQRYDHDQLAFKQSWVAFDDEQVIVLGERKDERVLARYDFTR